jgi:hypothetical protein
MTESVPPMIDETGQYLPGYNRLHLIGWLVKSAAFKARNRDTRERHITTYDRARGTHAYQGNQVELRFCIHMQPSGWWFAGDREEQGLRKCLWPQGATPGDLKALATLIRGTSVPGQHPNLVAKTCFMIFRTFRFAFP